MGKDERRWKRSFFIPSACCGWSKPRWRVRTRLARLARGARISFSNSPPWMRGAGRRLIPNVLWGIYEPECGYLDARALPSRGGCVRGEGGEYRQVAVSPDELDSGPLRSLTLSDGSRFKADRYVFACGPWLGKLFPETLGKAFAPLSRTYFSSALPPETRATAKTSPGVGRPQRTIFLRHPRQRPPRLQSCR